MLPKICSFPECSKPHSCKGYCRGHYSQFRLGKALKPLGGTTLTTEERFFAKVEKTESCWNWKASVNLQGYGTFWINPRNYGAHRAAYLLFVGDIPDGLEVDHKCRNILCVNPDHLRLLDSQSNSENHSGATVRSTSGVRGVFWNSGSEKWHAKFMHNRKIYQVGYFDRIEDAEKAVVTKRNDLCRYNSIDRT